MLRIIMDDSELQYLTCCEREELSSNCFCTELIKEAKFLLTWQYKYITVGFLPRIHLRQPDVAWRRAV